MSVLLLKQLVYRDVHCFLQDRHLAAIEGAREESTLLLRNFYKVWEKVQAHDTLLLCLRCFGKSVVFWMTRSWNVDEISFFDEAFVLQWSKLRCFQ